MSTIVTDSIKESLIQSFLPKSRNGINSRLSLPKEAAAVLPELEIPGRKWEEWRYTNLKSLVSTAYLPGNAFEVSEIQDFLIPGFEGDILVFLNGVYAPTLSKVHHNTEVLHITPLSQLEGKTLHIFEEKAGKIQEANHNIFTAINSAYIQNGVCIYAPKNAVGKAPIHLLHLGLAQGSDTSIQHRNLFVADSNSQFEVIETFHSFSQEATLRNALTEVWVDQNARLSYLKLQQESETASQIDHTAAVIQRDSSFTIHTLSLGGNLIRNNLHITLDAPNGEAHLLGLSMLDGDQHVDNHTQVDHAKPHCYSNELYKGIIAGRATGVFNGRIHVYQDAQKTNAFQSNRNILMSDTANIYTKPQLEIYADDVKCSHGATTGKLDADAMFYLRARGLNELAAKKLLIQAFATEVTESIEIDAVREHLVKLIEQRF